MSIKTLKLKEIESKTDSLYEAVMVISKRARQINTEINEQIKSQLGNIEVDEESGEQNIDRESIISEFDRKAKPTSIAIEELFDNNLNFEYEDEEQV